MSLLDEVLKANEAYVADIIKEYGEAGMPSPKTPQRHIAILTCMDTRLVDLLERTMGINRGDANVIRVAGNCITDVFSDVIRSLVVSIYELGAKEIFIVGHEDCGMEKTCPEELSKRMIDRGISPEAITMIRCEMDRWAKNFCHSEQNVIKAVAQLRQNPLIPNDVKIHGLMLNPYTSKLTLLVDGNKPNTELDSMAVCTCY